MEEEFDWTNWSTFWIRHSEWLIAFHPLFPCWEKREHRSVLPSGLKDWLLERCRFGAFEKVLPFSLSLVSNGKSVPIEWWWVAPDPKTGMGSECSHLKACSKFPLFTCPLTRWISPEWPTRLQFLAQFQDVRFPSNIPILQASRPLNADDMLTKSWSFGIA